MSKTSLRLKSKKIAIVTHEATTGPAHDLRDYLYPLTKELLFVAHPLLYIPANFKNSSRYEQYKKGVLISKGKSHHWSFPEIILYFKDMLYTFYWVLKFIHKTDIFIGVGNINAVAGIILKKIGRTKKVVFYGIDYVPKRFDSRFINTIYHYIDKIAVEHSDATWNLSPRMEEGRNEKWRKILGNQITVPIGIWYERISKNRSKSYNSHEIIYLGTILEKQGLDMCVEAVYMLQKKIKDISLTIIGSGPYENVIKSLVKKRNLHKRVTFLGYVPDHAEVEKRLSKASLAFALYNPKKDVFSYYADPGKIKSYLACGLPTMLTDIPYIARIIEKKRCGIVVNYKLEDIVNKIEEYYSHPSVIKEYRKNAINFSKQFNWPEVIDHALDQSKL